MIIFIKSAQQAEEILRTLGSGNKPSVMAGMLIFDLSPTLDPKSIPFIWNMCQRCEKPSEYLGGNIWGQNFIERSIYCQNCGYVMVTLACVTLAIQGGKVIATNYRFVL